MSQNALMLQKAYSEPYKISIPSTDYIDHNVTFEDILNDNNQLLQSLTFNDENFEFLFGTN